MVVVIKLILPDILFLERGGVGGVNCGTVGL